MDKIKRQGIVETCKINEKIICDTPVTYITFDNLEKTGIIKQAFSTRIGGVSKGEFATMNFSFTRGDDPQDVMENYRRIAAVLGCSPENIIATHQTHTTNVRKVTGKDSGMGVIKERTYSDVDGLITNEPGIVLACFFADCVPLYIVDPVHRAIGLSHSGWRGTVAGMGRVTLEAMQREFGTRPSDVQVAIGPSICQSCYEVSDEVAFAFKEQFPENRQKAVQYLSRFQPGPTARDIDHCLIFVKDNGKYQLNLWYANYRVFRDAGVPDEQIAVTGLCTCCNPDFLFSHRESHGRRGNLGAFLALK